MEQPRERVPSSGWFARRRDLHSYGHLAPPARTIHMTCLQSCLMSRLVESWRLRGGGKIASLLMTTGCLSALLLTGRSTEGRPFSDRSEEIRLKAENGFDGLSWEVDIWRDGDGF